MVDLEKLTDEDRQHIAEIIISECNEGDLVGEDYKGWWKLKFEKWDD